MTNEAENLGTRYRIDAGRGSFTVQAFAEGMLSFMGHNPTFAVRKYGGEIQFSSGDTQVESMLVVAQGGIAFPARQYERKRPRRNRRYDARKSSGNRQISRNSFCQQRCFDQRNFKRKILRSRQTA